MDADQLKFVAALLALSTTSGGAMGYAYGWVKGKLDSRRKLDTDNIIVVTITSHQGANGQTIIEGVTDPQLYELHKFFGDPALEKKAKKRISKCEPGKNLFEPGPDRALAMSKVSINITGQDKAATIAAANGRHDDYNRDSMVFTLTKSNAEGGTKMPYVICVAEKFLPNFTNSTFLEEVVPGDDSDLIYIDMLKVMADEFVESQKVFHEHPNNKKKTKRKASVGVVEILTMKSK
jgi:hypothetical protein